MSLFFQQVGAAAPGPNIGSFAPQGCYTEGNGVRALSAKMVNDQVGMTNEVCASACQGYTYFGTEYSSECKFDFLLRGLLPTCCFKYGN